MPSGEPDVPTCFLHAGAHKTGTSAFQEFARDNRAVLADLGILYPETGASRRGSHLPLMRELAGCPIDGRSRRLPDRLKAELAAQPDRHVLASAEYLEDTIIDGSFERILALFRSAGYGIHVILYVRNQPQYLNSRYAQLTKTFRQNILFESFVLRGASDPRYQYDTFADELDRLGVTATFCPYNERIKRAGLAWDLLERVLKGPVDPASFVPARWINTSIGPVALAAIQATMNRFEQRFLDLNHRQQVACKSLFVDAHDVPRWSEQPFCGLDTETTRLIEAKFAERNEAFARRVWGKSWNDAFAEDIGCAFQRNVFQPAEASEGDHLLFEAIMDETWPQAFAIATDLNYFAERPARLRPSYRKRPGLS